MARPRDNQRQRLYSAERLAFIGTKLPVELDGSLDSVQQWLDKIVKTSWAKRTAVDTGRIIVKRNYRGTESSIGGFVTKYRGKMHDAIALAEDHRDKPWIVLHEVVHAKLEPNGFAAHGPEFSKVLLSGTKRFFGNEAADLLRNAYSEYGVKYRTSRI